MIYIGLAAWVFNQKAYIRSTIRYHNMSYDRRTFIKQVGMGLGAAYCMPAFWACSSPSTGHASKEIGLQLYTLRELLAGQLEATLSRVAEIGYSHVETFGPEIGPEGKVSFWGAPLADFGGLLQKYGLKTYSGHYNLTAFLTPGDGDEVALKTYIDAAAELGQQYLVVPVPPMDRIGQFTVSDYQFIADQLNKGAELAAKSGLKMGYHNHFWEFRQLEDGSRGLDILLTRTEKEIAFELDLFWTEKSGVSSTDYFATYPGRFPLWHVKDMDKANTAPVTGPGQDQKPLTEILPSITYAEVGTGAIDFKQIFAQRETAGLQHLFVEQDIITIDPFESIRQSYDYVATQLLK